MTTTAPPPLGMTMGRQGHYAGAVSRLAAFAVDVGASWGLFTAGAGDSMRRQLQTLADRTIRYIRIYQVSDPHSWQTAGDVEHAQILEALINGDEPGALIGMAHHLSRTALRVLADCSPDYIPTAVPHAVALIEDGRAPAVPLTSVS